MKFFVSQLLHAVTERKISYEKAFNHITRKQSFRADTRKKLFKLGYETLIYYHSIRLLARREGFSQTPSGIASYMSSRGFEIEKIVKEVEKYADSIGGIKGLAVKYGYPPLLVERLSSHVDYEELEGILRSLNVRKRWLRVNILKTSVETALTCLRDEGFKYQGSKFTGLSYRLLGGAFQPVNSIKCVKKGLLIPQDVSSVLAIQASGPFEGTLLDACSSPGLKLQLALSLSRGLKAVAVDYSPRRVGYIREVLSTYGGLDRVVVLNGDSTLLDYRSIFDKALLDVPCTGTGAIYSDPTVKIRFSPLSLERLKSIQLKLLRRVLRNSRRVIYISCSILPDEGELIVDEAVRENLVEPVPLSEPYLSKAYKGFKSSDNTYRIMPHIVDGQGMYLAVLESKVHTG